MSSFNLSSQKWQNRVLLVFAPSVDNRDYQQQMQLFDQYQNGFTDRDLVLVQVLADKSYANGQLIDQSSVANLRSQRGLLTNAPLNVEVNTTTPTVFNNSRIPANPTGEVGFLLC